MSARDIKHAQPDRDGKPGELGVELRWRVEVDPQRRRRIGEILADILDNVRDSGGASKP